MKIAIPEQYEEYFELLIRVGYGNTQQDVINKLFRDGLETVISDISVGAWEHPDISPSFLDSLRNVEKITYEIKDRTEDASHIKPISKNWGWSIELTKTVIFVMGLGNDGYTSLRFSNHYETDLEFRKIVDEMPHDRAIDEGGDQ
jgi:hypothetical protein